MSTVFSRKFFIPFAIAIVLLAGIGAGTWRYHATRAALIENLILNAQRCALAFDPDELRNLTGTAADHPQLAFTEVTRRLVRLRRVETGVRSVYLFRHQPATDQIVVLADSTSISPTASAGRPVKVVPHLQEVKGLLSSREPVTYGPVADLSGNWVTAFARVGGDNNTGANEILGLEVDADTWSRSLWAAGIGTAAYVGLFLILPLAALISARRQNRQRDTLRNLTEAMEQGQTAVMIVARNQRIQYANAGFCRQLGFSREELLGREWREFQGFEAPQELIKKLVETVGAGQPWSGEWRMRRKDGGFFPVRGGVTPVKDRGGVIRSFVVVFQDVTEIRQTESMLREAKERAEAGDRAKGQFLATMSHEVRTPLNGIVGFASLILDTELTPEQQEFVATIRTSSETLIQLTGDILDYARIESGRLKLEPQPCDPRVCVENALDLVAAMAAEKNLELLHWVDESVPLAIMVDVSRLRQVLVNLLNNAIKFTPSGEVAVSVRALDDPAVSADKRSEVVLEFSVRDTGIGIESQHHARIFRPFSQVDESTTRRFGGTGLGLAICKNIVELMEGTVSFVSAPGAGSTFTFTIRAPLHPSEDLMPAQPNLAGQRLAVVAGNRGMQEELLRLGRRIEADVFATEFEDLVARTDWDVAVVDVSDAVAVEVAARVTPHPSLPSEKVVGLVSIMLPPEIRTALRTHFRVLLNKPPHQDTLCGLLAARASTSPFEPPPPVAPLEHFDLNVLIVEDNAVNQQLIQRVVMHLGCRWSAAVNGQVALEHLANRTPDVVLMDLHMPEMDGLSATKMIRAGTAGESARNVWIIALTADARAEQRQRTLAAGANDYLTKPVRIPELTQALRRFIKAREQRV